MAGVKKPVFTKLPVRLGAHTARKPAKQAESKPATTAAPQPRISPASRRTSKTGSEFAAVRKLRVAIVHDWLYGGGAELVVEQLHILFPEAPIYTSYCSDEWRRRLDNKVVTGWLQWWPFANLRKFIPFLRIWWFTHLDLSGYDLVISSSGAEAKGIRIDYRKRGWASKLFSGQGAGEHRKGAVQTSTVTAEQSAQRRHEGKSSRGDDGFAGSETAAVRRPVHVNYCHAPTHYYWSRYNEYMKHPGFGAFDWLARIGLKLLVGPLRRWDYKAAQRPDYIIANSTHIQKEIQKYYDRKATVIFPPVYFERFQKPQNLARPRKGYVISGRQTPYKRFDIAVQACTQLGLPLTVIGAGPDHKRLRKLAGHSITFLGRVTDEVLEEEFAHAEAFLFPGLDDFGITPVEAMAAGTPIVAYKDGGALDYVQPGVTGVFFDYQTVESLVNALQEFNSAVYAHATIAQHAERFSAATFQQTMQRYLLTAAAKRWPELVKSAQTDKTA